MPVVLRRRHLQNRIRELEGKLGIGPRSPEDRALVTELAVKVARDPRLVHEVPERARTDVDVMVKALQAGATAGRPRTLREAGRSRGIPAEVLAARAHAALGPSSTVTPGEIQLALQQQGINWAEPFSPGQPLTPYYGYNRRPRDQDYRVGRNITTDTRVDRIPFQTLLQLWKSYDIAQICTRHAINDLRSMRIRFEVMDDFDGKDPSKELARAKQFWRKPDGKRSLKNWLCKHAMDVWRYDAGTLYKLRDRAGNLKHLKVVDGTTIAPMLDYFGDEPTGEAPAYLQTIQGIPWDWLRASDLVYEPMWPEPEDPYGTPPLETVLVNANTDLRLQLYFLQFFTAGNVPEAFAIAPEDQSDSDGLADLQETWEDWTYGDQSERWGLRWLPHGTEIEPYKPQEFDPDVAEYVMRRTVSAFMMVPQDMGFTDDVNRASGETQVDVQFRVGTSPNVGYYEDIIDDITQQDLGLPVQARFDTGRESEDRLMTAKAHQIYVSMGAERSSDVRSKALGYRVDPKDQTPLMYDSMRLGPVPMKYLLEISGEYDRNTGMPLPESIKPREFVVPGMMAPDPLVGTEQATGDYALAPGSDPDDPDPGAPAPKGPARKGQAESPGGRDEPAGALPPGYNALSSGSALAATASPQGSPGYNALSSGSALAATASPQGSPGYGVADLERQAELDDLARWQRNARKAVARGRSPRPFADSAITDGTFSRIWPVLGRATSRAQVDAAFKGAAEPPFGGVAIRAADTGRVLMIQRARTEGDPAGGCWELPGGHIDEGETCREGSVREWREETGCAFPPSAEPVDTWDSHNGVYRGHVYEVPSEDDVDLRNRDASADPDGDYFEALAWADTGTLSQRPDLRPELKADMASVQHALQAPVVKRYLTVDEARDAYRRAHACPECGAHDIRPVNSDGDWWGECRSCGFATSPIDGDGLAPFREAATRQARAKAWEGQRREPTGRWRVKGPRWEDFHRRTDELVGANTPAIAAAMARLLDPSAVQRAVRDAYRAGSATTALDALAAVPRASDALTVAIAELYAAAYAEGAEEAAEACHGTLPPWMVPAGALEARKALAETLLRLAAGGLGQLLRALIGRIRGIADTQVKRISATLAQAIAGGEPMSEAMASVEAIVHDDAHAQLVAEMEYCRAMAVAAMETYLANEVPEIQWLHQPDACTRCMENAAVSPQPTISPAWPNGPLPVHPHERCVIAPVIYVGGEPLLVGAGR